MQHTAHHLLHTVHHLSAGLHTAGLALTLASIAYLLLALRQTAHFRERHHARTPITPGVTVLVPVHGAPPRLYECLISLFLQDYPRFQIVFGLHRAEDPGRAVIERLIAQFPQVDALLVIDEQRIGSNPKVCNLANIYGGAKHDVIVMVDSDVVVEPGFLETVVEPFADPAVGGVTCLYKGAPDENLPSRLGALYINDWFIPSALVDLSLREMDLCYGAAMAVTRASLAAIGGLTALASAVAEDDVLGERLHRAGFKIRLAPCVVTTIVAEPDFASLWCHELRWMRSVRACRPRDHVLSVVMHALAPAAVLVSLAPSRAGYALLLMLIALRLVTHAVLRARIDMPAPPAPWLIPLRECLNFAVWAASFLSRSMSWGQLRLTATGKRRMAMGEPGSA